MATLSTNETAAIINAYQPTWRADGTFDTYSYSRMSALVMPSAWATLETVAHGDTDAHNADPVAGYDYLTASERWEAFGHIDVDQPDPFDDAPLWVTSPYLES